MGSPIHPLLGPSVLVDTPSHVYPLQGLSGFDTICNRSSPPLVDIVLFGVSFKIFKTHLLGKGFHTLIRNVLFSSLTSQSLCTLSCIIYCPLLLYCLSIFSPFLLDLYPVWIDMMMAYPSSQACYLFCI